MLEIVFNRNKINLPKNKAQCRYIIRHKLPNNSFGSSAKNTCSECTLLLPEKDYLGKEDRLSGKCARDKFVLQLQDICLEKVDFCLAIARQICLVRNYQINCLLFQDSTFMGVLLHQKKKTLRAAAGNQIVKDESHTFYVN